MPSGSLRVGRFFDVYCICKEISLNDTDMNHETPSTGTQEREKSPAEQKIADLQKQLDDANFMVESLRIESASMSVAETDAREAREDHDRMSDAAMSKEGSLTQEEEEDLINSDAKKAETAEWRDDSIAHSTLQAPVAELHAWKSMSPEFKQKLEDIGIDTTAKDKYGILKISEYDGVKTAVYERMAELQRQIREAKLEIPGEKEELVREAIAGSTGDVDLSTFEVMAGSQLKDMDTSFAMSPGDVAQPLVPVMSRLESYPEPVQQEAVRQLTKRAAMKAGVTDIAKVERLSGELFEYLKKK